MSQNFGSSFIGNYIIVVVYRALDWPFSMSGTTVMAQTPHLHKNPNLYESSIGGWCG